jgi:hypothetical protein
MRLAHGSLVHVAGTTAIGVLGLIAALSPSSPAGAQCEGGEFTLQQESGIVGWLYVNGDRTVEWWAYIDGLYHWGDASSTGSNTWHLEAEYLSAGSWGSYTAWKAAVLQRSPAQGHDIVFQQHAVIEETVSN